MISLFYDDSNKVYLKYFVEIPKELEKEKHLKVKEVKDPEEKEGKVAVLMANEKDYWYEYVDEVVEDEN